MNRIRLLLLVVLFAAIVGGASWLLRRPRGDVASVSGTIETDEVHVASRYGGRVEILSAQEGDRLGPGQLIAELDAAELRARRDQAVAALAELANGPRTNEIAAAQHAWESIKADLALAQADARRALELFAQKTVAEDERDRAVARVATLEQNARAAEAQYRLLLEGTRPERLAQAQAQLAEIDAQLGEMTITAPGVGAPIRSGRPAPANRSGDAAPTYLLEVLSVKVGDVLPPNREVATLLLTQHLWVRVYVPEPWLGAIQPGQTVRVFTDSPGRPEFTGVVEQINRQAEFTPRNVQTVEDRVKQVFGVKIRLPGNHDRLRPGMSVDVIFNPRRNP